ncbi:PQQ-like beta-propeller repeat protein [Acidianus sp. HS-5]|uniref:PQQ-like beta-propeller repeat protein n=1 Tax=Acidianus sp. HS-5 TaxID=2886040 RepID=UPI001F44BFC9|nr:PQQ-like beta-propeller repeat protein [Acidianus sp. HS-5]
MKINKNSVIINSLIFIMLITLVTTVTVSYSNHPQTISYSSALLKVGNVTSVSMYKYPVDGEYLIGLGSMTMNSSGQEVYHALVVAVGSSGTKILYNISEPYSVYSVAICPKYFAVGLGTTQFNCTAILRVYSIVSGELLWCTKFPFNSQCAIDSVADIKILCNEVIAIANPEVYGYPYGNLSAFNASNGKLLWFYTIQNMSPEPEYMSISHMCVYNCYVVATAGNGVATGGWVFLFNLHNGKLLWINSSLGDPYAGPPVFSGNGKYIVISSSVIYAYSGVYVLTTCNASLVWSNTSYSPGGVMAAINYNGSLVAYTASGGLYIANCKGQILYSFIFPIDELTPVVMNCQGSVIAALPYNCRTLYIFSPNGNIANYTLPAIPCSIGPNPQSLVMSADGKVIAVGTQEGLAIFTTKIIPLNVKVTFQYKVIGQMPPYLPSITLTFPNGTTEVVKQGTYILPSGTAYTISNITENEVRWTSPDSRGILLFNGTTIIPLYEQLKVNFSYVVKGVGNGEPTISYYYFGTNTSAKPGVYWADYNSTYYYAKCLPGSNDEVRWISYNWTGRVLSNTVTVTYYTQDYVNVISNIPVYAKMNGVTTELKSSWFNYSTTIQIINSTYYVNKMERYVIVSITPSSLITVTSPETIHVHTVLQYYVTVTPNITLNALVNGTSSTFSSGWYNAGTNVYLKTGIIPISAGERLLVTSITPQSFTVNLPTTVKVTAVTQYLVTINGASSWYNAGCKITLTASVPFYEIGTFKGTYNVPPGTTITVNQAITETLVESLNPLFIILIVIIIVAIVLAVVLATRRRR